MTVAAAWPVCTICYEDLRPLSDQHLHCLPSCGHVFHALCLEQWLEYCPGGKKKLTCPMCKQPCGAAHPPTRLFFQSTGFCPTQPCSLSQEEADPGVDPDVLAAEVARLEQKAASLGRVLEEQRDGIQKLNAEVVRWREQAAMAEATRDMIRKEKDCVQHLLNAKIEELSRKTSECGRLQEKSLALAKELASLKLSTDMNLQEEEIFKLVSLGNHGSLENAVDVLKRSLALRNKSYKELMAQCNLIGRSESRTQQKFEKARELIKKLKARVQDLEKELEEKGNDFIRDLRFSKKFKADQNLDADATANNGFPSPSAGYGNQTKKKLDEVTQDPCDKQPQLSRLTDETTSDLNLKYSLQNKSMDVIDLDADDTVLRDAQRKGSSANPSGNYNDNLHSLNQSNHSQHENIEPTTFGCQTSSYVAEQTSFLKHTMSTRKSIFQENVNNKPQNLQELPVLRSIKVTTSSWEKETLTIDGISKEATRLASGTGPQHIHNLNSLSDDFQTPAGIGMEGARKSIGKWCKGKVATGSLSSNASKRNLIAVGPDGRGGKVKVLRDLGQFQGSKTQALWPKSQKHGSRGGQSQIDQFFGKR